MPVVLQAKTGATTTKYLYSMGTRPIGQYTSAWEYLLPDALGSVRQIVDASGNVTLAESYEPYGSVLTSTGTASSIFGYAGEQIDTYIKLVFLRARYYSPETARFLSKDVWQGDYTRPQSLNAWMYVEGDPVNYTDPSGYLAQTDETSADNIRAALQATYDVVIPKDYGVDTTGYGCPGWRAGAWRNLQELQWTEAAINDMATAMGNNSKFEHAMNGPVTIVRRGWTSADLPVIGPIRPFAPPVGVILGDVNLPDWTFSRIDVAKYNIVHELGHVWDRRKNLQLSEGMSQFLQTKVCRNDGMGGWRCGFDVTAGSEPPTGYLRVRTLEDWKKEGAAYNAMEDWAESVASVVYSAYWAGGQPLGPNRRQYVQNQIVAIP